MVVYLGCDVGGQSVKAVAVDEGARVLSRARRATGRDTDIESLAASLRELVAELGNSTAQRALGVGIAGVIGSDGVLRGSPNLPALVGRSVAADLSAALAIPVVVENDANCAAYAEGWHGAAAGVSDYLVLTLGTGLGSGLVLGGNLYRGSTGYACELGHMVIRADGRRCGCGNRGCLEAYASDTAVRAILAERGDRLAAAVDARVHDRGEGSTEALFALASQPASAGELRGEADRLCMDLIGTLGVGLASAVNVLDVETVILAGGIAPAVLSRIDTLRASMATSLFARSVDRVAVRAALHGDDAGAVGAARLAMEAL